jgi:serine/threonine protein kinase
VGKSRADLIIDSKDDLAQSKLFSVTRKVAIDSAPVSAAQGVQPGSVVDKKYKILSLLGEGGMGSVYKAHHLALDKEVALKTFRAQAISEESWKRFQREAQAIGRLNHKNIVQVFDFGFSESRIPFYTMECLSGESLADRIDSGRRPSLEEALTIFIQVCQALTIAHNKGIIHRDIKPANIFLARDILQDKAVETVKVVDFGIAGLAADNPGQSASGQPTPWTNQRLTADGTIFGSPLYMSPEQALAEEVGPASDIYSTGCALFETLTGDPPYRGETAFTTMMMHQRAEIPMLAAHYQGELPLRLSPLVGRMLAKNPSERPRSFDEVERELQEILLTLNIALGRSRQTSDKSRKAAGISRDGAASGGHSTDAEEDSRPSSLARSGIIAALLVMLIGAGAFYFLRSKTETVSPATSDSGARAGSLSGAGLQPTIIQRSTAVPNISLKSTSPYFVQTQGTEKTYKFPNFSIGEITWPAEPGIRRCRQEIQAQGEVAIPVLSYGFNFDAGDEVSNHPELLDGFVDGDLRKLRLTSDRRFSNEHIKHAAHLTRLRYLAIGDPDINDRSFDDLAALKSLVNLDIKGTSYSAAKIKTLPVLTRLETLQVSNMPDSVTLVKALYQAPRLSTVDLCDCELTDNDMPFVAGLNHVVKLNLSDNDKLTEKGLKHLAKMPHLRELNIALTGMGPQALPILKGFPALKSLIIGQENWNAAFQDKARLALPGVELAQEGSLKAYKKNASPDVVKDFLGKSVYPDVKF